MIADINRLGGAFSVRVEPFRQEDFVASRLCDPTLPDAARMVGAHAAVRGLEPNRFAGSLVFQRYCHRVCGAAVAALVLHDSVLDVSMPNCAMRFREGSPDTLILRNLEVLPVADPKAVVDMTVGQHLEPLAQVISKVSGPGMPNLWGNMAAGFAGAFRKLSLQAHNSAELARVRALAEQVAAAHPKLQRGGSYRLVTLGEKTQLQFERTSCCHWYAAKDGKYCSWCSKISPQERQQRFLQLLQDQ